MAVNPNWFGCSPKKVLLPLFTGEVSSLRLHGKCLVIILREINDFLIYHFYIWLFVQSTICGLDRLLYRSHTINVCCALLFYFFILYIPILLYSDYMLYFSSYYLCQVKCNMLNDLSTVTWTVPVSKYTHWLCTALRHTHALFKVQKYETFKW
jgi:pheromone shutdown protein TraB